MQWGPERPGTPADSPAKVSSRSFAMETQDMPAIRGVSIASLSSRTNVPDRGAQGAKRDRPGLELDSLLPLAA